MSSITREILCVLIFYNGIANDEYGNGSSDNGSSTYSSPQAIRRRASDILSHYNNNNNNGNSPLSENENVDAYNGFELI